MDNKLNCKIELWKQMQTMVCDIENRNHSILGFSTIVPSVLTLTAWVISGNTTSDLQTIISIIIPTVFMFAMFSGAFHNKYSAIIRGYIAAIEDSINKDLDEQIFIWNKGYSELFHKQFF